MAIQYVTDTKGNKTNVLLPIKDYQKILDNLEEFEAIKAYDYAKKHQGKSVDFEDLMKELHID